MLAAETQKNNLLSWNLCGLSDFHIALPGRVSWLRSGFEIHKSQSSPVLKIVSLWSVLMLHATVFKRVIRAGMRTAG